MNAAFQLKDGISYLNFMTPGVVGMALMFSSTMAGVSVLWDKQFGFMREILVAPVSRTNIMFGKVVGSVTISFIQAGFLLLTATLLGVTFPNLTALLQFIVFMVLISLSFVSLGLGLASKMEDPVAFPVVINFLIMPLFFLSGALFPLSTAPTWMQVISYFNPLRYGVDGLRGSMLGSSDFSLFLDFGILFVFFVGIVLLGGYLFKRMSG